MEKIWYDFRLIEEFFINLIYLNYIKLIILYYYLYNKMNKKTLIINFIIIKLT